MDYELMFLKGLAWTIFLETAVMIVYFRLIDKRIHHRISKLLQTGFIASFATLPYLWFVFPIFMEHKIAYVVVGETFAVLMETLIINALLRTQLRSSFLCSLTCNMFSFITGLIYNLNCQTINSVWLNVAHMLFWSIKTYLRLQVW